MIPTGIIMGLLRCYAPRNDRNVVIMSSATAERGDPFGIASSLRSSQRREETGSMTSGAADFIG